MEPDELIEFQNQIFGFMINIVNEHHGNINQFMGDGFMATFGAPKSHGNDAKHAVQASWQILRELDKVNRRGEIPKTNVGIGLHTGLVVTGNVGTEHRKQFSVTGETVIIAARVEQLNKLYNSRLIMAHEVASHLVDLPLEDFEDDQALVKGRDKPVSILIMREKERILSNTRSVEGG